MKSLTLTPISFSVNPQGHKLSEVDTTAPQTLDVNNVTRVTARWGCTERRSRDILSSIFFSFALLLSAYNSDVYKDGHHITLSQK